MAIRFQNRNQELDYRQNVSPAGKAAFEAARKKNPGLSYITWKSRNANNAAYYGVGSGGPAPGTPGTPGTPETANPARVVPTKVDLSSFGMGVVELYLNADQLERLTEGLSKWVNAIDDAEYALQQANINREVDIKNIEHQTKVTTKGSREDLAARGVLGVEAGQSGLYSSALTDIERARLTMDNASKANVTRVQMQLDNLKGQFEDYKTNVRGIIAGQTAENLQEANLDIAPTLPGTPATPATPGLSGNYDPKTGKAVGRPAAPPPAQPPRQPTGARPNRVPSVQTGGVSVGDAGKVAKGLKKLKPRGKA